MQPEYKITEKQLNILDDIIAELEQDKTLSLPCKFISYILSEVRDQPLEKDQPLEDKENTEKQENEPQKQKKKADISDIVRAGKSIQAIANDVAEKMGMCDLPEGVSLKHPEGKVIGKVVF